MHTAAYSTIGMGRIRLHRLVLCGTREMKRRKCTILWTHVCHAWKHYYYVRRNGMTKTMGRRMRRMNKSYLHSQPICICVFICDVWFSLGQHFLSAIPHTFLLLLLLYECGVSSLVLCHRSLRNWTQDYTYYIFHVWPLDYYVLSAAHKLSVCCEKKIVVPSVEWTRRHNFCRRIVQHEFICRRRRTPCDRSCMPFYFPNKLITSTKCQRTKAGGRQSGLVELWISQINWLVDKMRISFVFHVFRAQFFCLAREQRTRF